jgi:CheY-like chemotaxis protein
MSEQVIDILLVEDNSSDLELTIHALQKYKLANNIHIARDGAEALDLLQPKDNRVIENKPKVILLDLKLPKVDGLQVLKALKSDSRTKNIPVVILTSSREERDLVESYALGVNSYIVKPVDFTQFIEAVQHLGLYWLLLNEPPTELD